MRPLFRIATVLACLVGPAAGAASLPVPEGGTLRAVPGAHELPDPSLDYRIVVDMQTLAAQPTGISPAVQKLAALVNTFAKAGVTPDHVHVVAVFRGTRVVLAANDAAYAAHTGGRANPNLPLLRQLAHAGVTLAICGQAAEAQHYDASMFMPETQMNLSGIVTFLNLQTRGYVRIEQ
jgi:intracellular sulfur oxidation DsrE/DsrF family protein